MSRCCSVEPIILKGFHRIENDDTPDATTKLYRVTVLQCRNPKCTNYGHTWEEAIEETIGDDMQETTGMNNIANPEAADVAGT